MILTNKEDFSNKDFSYLLDDLEVACNSTDILAPIAVQVILNKLKKHNITFTNVELESKKDLTVNEELFMPDDIPF